MGSLYVHIPFCEKKCLYCDFYSIETTTHVDRFLQALHREFSMYAARGGGGSFDTLFFGGGTPSLLTPDQISGILNALSHHFRLAPDAEITLETNPGTVDLAKLKAYRSLGVNRLSIGVQSFHPAELRFLDRIHDADQARACVRDARKAGFENVSLDLIFALPGQTDQAWRENLHDAVALGVDHISAYSLIVEEHTPLARLVSAGQVTPAATDLEAGLYETTMEFMFAHGFDHYEVSNYARPGYRSRHNYAYWTHDNYLGFGPSAHSFWHDDDFSHASRWANIAHLGHYMERILDKNEAPLGFTEQVEKQSLMNERIFLGLRADGVDIGRLKRDLGVEFSREQRRFISALIANGSALVSGEIVRLTSAGYLMCDEIAARLIV